MKKAGIFLIIILTAAGLISCSTRQGAAGTAGSDTSAVSVLEGGTETQAGTRSTAENSIPEPVTVSGVMDFLSPRYSFLWNTFPREGTPVFFASTPRREFREEEAEYCLYDAARQVSLYYAARVETKLAVKANNKDLGLKESVKTGFDRDLAGKIMKDLTVLYHFRDNEGTYMLVSCPDFTLGITAGEAVAPLDKAAPRWITEIPVFKGMLVSVGVVERSRYLTDSLKKADDQVLANLSRQVSINVKSKRMDLEMQRGTAFDETHYDVSSSIIKGFYILARWRTGDGNTYYSLGVCKKGIEEKGD